MNRLVNWFAANPIAANFMMLFIIFSGLSGISNIDKEVQPNFNENIVVITISYPGAGPRDIEQQICVRIEESIESLQGIQKVTCSASNNIGTARIEASDGYPLEKLLNNVKSRVDAISTFPADSERPVIEQSILRVQALNIGILGGDDEKALKELSYQIKDELSALPDVPEVSIAGIRDYEVSIEVDEKTLRQYGLSFNQVAQIVSNYSLNLGGGVIRSDNGEIQIQARNQAYVATDFANIPLLGTSDGQQLMLGDFASIRDAFVDEPQLSRMNGQLATLLNVYTGETPNVLRVAEAAKAYVKERKKSLPAGYQLLVWQDQSQYFDQRLNTLVKNGFNGLILLLIVLLLFLRPALAIWVTIGIAVAFIGSLLVLPIVGTSLNVITLFAYIMVLGIVVDDAIIVGESIYAQQQRGNYGVRSAQIGAGMMVQPVFFAVLTSILVFVPLLLLSGDWAYFMAPLATIPVLVLIFSLLESCLMLPSHLAHLKPEGKPMVPVFNRLRKKVESGFQYFLTLYYRPFISKCLHNRGNTIAWFILFFMLSLSLVIGGWVKIKLTPDVELDSIQMTITFNEKVPFNEIDSISRHIEASALEAEKALTEEGDEGYIKGSFFNLEGKKLTAIIELVDENQRSHGTIDFSRQWQKYIGVINQAERFDVIDSVNFDEADLELRIFGKDVVELDQAGEWLKQQLAAIDGMHSIQDNLALGRPELEVVPNQYANFFGVDLRLIATQLRRAFYGQEVQRIPRGREDVKVMVRYPQEQRNDINSLNEFRIRTNDGREIPLQSVADTRYSEGYAQITRVDGQVSVKVFANYDNDNQSLSQRMRTSLPEIINSFKREYPEVGIELGGGQQETLKFVIELTRLGLMSIFIIYALLSIQFRSLLHPLLIITAIPFSLMGVLWAHLLTGNNISLMSVMGMLAAAGVVVNDTLVLIDHVNHNRKQQSALGLSTLLIRSAKNRFRPIFLTSVTTFMGLLPIMNETSTQAKFLKPMAISLASGVVTASVVSLLLIPCLYSLGHSLKRNFKPFFARHLALGWNGKQKLWICFSGYYFLGAFFMVLFSAPIIGILIGVFSFVSIPEIYSNYLGMVAFFIWVAAFLVWALTSTWRCAFNVKNTIWIPVIRSYVCLAWVTFIYQTYRYLVFA